MRLNETLERSVVRGGPYWFVPCKRHSTDELPRWIESLAQDVRPDVRSLARESLPMAAVVAMSPAASAPERP